MKLNILIVTYLLFCQVFIFPDNEKKGLEKNVTALSLNSNINIDGILSETIWQNEAVKGFIQKDPDEGKPATEETNVWIAYDESAFYIGARMYDSSPDSIIGLLSRRDYDNESDWFHVFIDPYFDRRSGYFFGVNAAGAITDGLLYNDSWDDDSWDGIWDYGVTKDDKGWSVEIRIPFTQIRFNESGMMKWGINFSRVIQRKNENSYFVMIPKKESGFVSRFAILEGLNGIKSRQRLEIMPYAVTKASYLLHDRNDPFYKSKQYSESIGLDMKIGIGSNLNLDATINPDFGQVEVDPAVVNLSAFETYYDEKRPFFIEGNNIFNQFGFGGTNSNWGFNWSNPEIFYSRRIGRSPRGSGSLTGYKDIPSETRILGAGKLTGKLGDDWSIGFLNAVTERTFAKTFNEGSVHEEEIEPLSNYSLARAQKEFSSGKYGLGFISTAVVRDLKTESMKNSLSRNSFVYGIDGWVTLDENETYVVTGFAAGSYVSGSRENLVILQKSPLRYFQRPDAVNYRLDSSRTSLSGYVTRIALNKQKGNFYINSAFGVASPGFEINDVGFQWRADIINSHLVLGYRWYEPDGIFRFKRWDFAHFRGYNFDGNLIGSGYMTFINLQFENYYGLNFQGGFNPEAYSTDVTRGGPIVRGPGGIFMSMYAYSDSRNKIVADINGNYEWDKLNSEYKYFGINLTWKPNSTINFSFGPFYQINDNFAQWIGRFDDPYAPTFGSRYVFGFINHKTAGGNIRLDWTFTPELSLQLFLQPLFSVGHYREFKELAQAGTYRTNIYGTYGSTIDYNEADKKYIVDPDGDGPAAMFSFNNPDFNFKSLRGNLVLRWEFLPGSVFFLVWTHDKTNLDNPGDFSLGRDFRNLWKTGSNNILLAKITYWLDV